MGTVDVVFVIFGLALICVAIFGGGIEVKEIKIPRAGRFARIFAGCAGCALVILGLVIEGTFFPNGSEPDNGLEDPNAAVILNVRLGKSEDGKQKEIETELSIALNGEHAAKFLLDPNSPSASRSVKLAKSGEYQYHIEGYSKWSTVPDNITVVGNGKIFLRVGRAYTVGASSIPSASTQEWIVYLKQDTIR